MRDETEQAIVEFGSFITDDWEPDRDWSQTELIDNALRQLEVRDRLYATSPSRLVRLRNALDEVLESNLSDADIGALWADTGARMSWGAENAMRDFFRRAKAAIGERLQHGA